MNNKRGKRILAYVSLALAICFSIIVFVKFSTNTSVGADNQKVLIEANLDKYINYEISDQDKGTLVQYTVKTGIEHENDVEYIPFKSNELAINLNQIDGKYPYAVKVIAKSTALTNGKTGNIEENYEYDSNTGNIIIRTSNENENGELINNTKPSEGAKDEYVIIAYYDTYVEQEQEAERELKIKVQSTVTLSVDDRKISQENEFKGVVKNNIGELTSVTNETDEIYNGYIKSNIINGTNYDTEYKETTKIMVSKKEAEQKIEFKENNSFLKTYQNENEEEISQEFASNGDLVYKSTKIKQEYIKRLLGENGVIQILDGNENLLATIDNNTQFEEDGSIVINYENEPESIIIKTSNIENEGILPIENTKKIKATMRNSDYTKIKTTTQIIGINEETVKNAEEEITEEKIVFTNDYENMVDLQDAQTNVSISVDNTEWTNKQQNEVTFDVSLNANTIKDNMFKNPQFKIELPSQVEKVILQNSGIFYGNGLELQEPYLETSENGNIAIVANLTGVQTAYSENALELTTDVKIAATIILKKDIETTQANANIVYTNQYTLDGHSETGNQAISLQIERYQEEQVPTITEENIATYSMATTPTNIDGLKLEVAPVKGETSITDGDTVYEGEYIKYNVKVTNTSDKTMNDVKIVGSVPEGTTYGDLVADWNNINGDYYYNFDENVNSKEIEIGTLEAGASTTQFYEVKVNDLEEGQDEKQITTDINAYVGELQAASYKLTNIVKPAEVKVFLSANLYGSRDTWNYHIYPTSDESKEVTVTVKLPKEFEPGYLFDYSSESITLTYDANNTPKDNIFTLTLKTNVEYYINGTMERDRLTEETEDSKITLIATASVTENNITYQSNENRILFEYENVAISMTSSNEGEEVKYGEEIDYNITIKNIGKNNIAGEYTSIFVNLTDLLPEEVKPISVTYENWEAEKENVSEDSYYVIGYNKLNPVTETIGGSTDEDGNRLPEVDLYLTIPYGESVNIQVKTTAGLVYEKTKVENSVTVTGDRISTKTSNIITHTILPYDYEEPSDDPDDPNNPDNPDNPDEPSNPDNPVNPNGKYSISGVAWLDENEDGQRQTSEKVLSGITVMVVDTKNATIVKDKIQTSSDGTYRFSDLDKGDYVVLFQYDTNTYRVTEYQKNEVASNSNSDAITKEVTLNGETLKVGMIEVSNLEASVSNMDIGLIENKICDLKLDKSITKVTVTTNSGTKQYSYDNEKLAKIEIKSKELQGATVVIEYKIVVTNEGELPATVSKVIDYLPEGLTFSSEINKNWSSGANRQLVNTSLSNQKIEVGESKELTLIVTKSMTANSTGTFTNAAEIGDITNSLGIADTDSTPGNKVQSEDDYSEASVILSVSTGIFMYISIGVVLAILIAVAVFLAHKYGILKIGKISLFGIMFVVILVSGIGESLSYYHEGTKTTYDKEDGFAKFTWAGRDQNGDPGHLFKDGTVDKYGVCDIEGKPAHGDNESNDNIGLYAYVKITTDTTIGTMTYYYNYTNKQYDATKKPTLALKSSNSKDNIPLKLSNNNDYLIGPFNFEYSNNNYLNLNSISYTLTVENAKNQTYERNSYSICDSNGKDLNLSGMKGTFYLKISKDNFNGISSVKLAAKAPYENRKRTTKKGYRLYFPINNETSKVQDDCQVVRSANKDGEKEVNIIVDEGWSEPKTDNATASIEWTMFNGCLKIQKIDKDSQKALANVEFSIKNSSGQYVKKDSNGNISYVSTKNDDTLFKTGSNGEEIFIDNLKPDKYTVIEENNPNYGYTVKIEDITKTLDKKGSIVTITRENGKQTGNLHIEKKDKDKVDNALSDISFKIKSIDLYEKLRLDIDQNGVIDVNDVTYLQKCIRGDENVKTEPHGLGDVNDDGEISIDDVTALQKYLSAYSTGSTDIYKYIVVTDNNGKEYKGTEVTQTISLSNMTTTTNPDEATIFTTDENGEINILNILTGSYILEEVSVGNNWQYDVDGEKISYEYENSDGKTSGEGNNIQFTISRQSSADTGVSSNITYNNKLNVYNKKKYIKLSGYAWEDIYDGKQSKPNSLWQANPDNDKNDKRLENVVVRLCDKDGNRIDETITDENGEYTFGDYDANPNAKKIEIATLKEGAYMRFYYNGLNYQTVELNCINEEGNKVENGNTAVEIGEEHGGEVNLRDRYNANYGYVENNKTLKEDGTNGFIFNYNYNKETYSSTLDYGSEARYGYEGAEYPILTSYSNTEHSDKFYITARTETNINPTNKKDYRLLGQNKTIDEILAEGYDEITNINLGLYKREQPDLAIAQDIDTVDLEINRYSHTYKYANRFSDKYTNNIDTSKYPDGIYNVGVKFGTKYGDESYSRTVYESDCKATGNEALKAYVTYKIAIKNQASELNARVNSLLEYYDKNYYTVSDAYLEDGTTLKYEPISYNNDEYAKVRIDTNLEIGSSDKDVAYVYVKFEIKKIGGIFYDAASGNALKDKIILKTYAEINSYSTFGTDKKIYAGIDKDSNPGNIEKDGPEDDNDWAPSLIITADKAREITGTVFFDESTGGIAVERKGDGVYNPDNEQGISGVKVELYKNIQGNFNVWDSGGNRITENPSGTTEYLDKDGNIIEGATATDSSGRFRIKDFIPGEYVIVYTWGDKTYIAGDINNPINVNDYKGTIYNEKEAREREGENDWYRETPEEQEWRKQRYSDALDDYGRRKEIDGENPTNINTMNSTTPTMNFGIEYKDEIEKATGKATGRSEYDAHKDGKLIFEVPNVDFGIVERARQQLDISKRVKTVKITLANGQTIVDAEVINLDVNDDGKLNVNDVTEIQRIKGLEENGTTLTEEQKLRADVNRDGEINEADRHEIGQYINNNDTNIYKLKGNTVNGVNYMGPSEENTPKNGYLNAEIDSELIQGSTIEIGYEIVVKNNSELDYNTEDYYLYGTKGTENQIITLKPTGVYDYLDSEMTLDSSKSDSNWKTVEISKINYNTETQTTEPTLIENYLEYTSKTTEDGKIINVTGYESSYEEYYKEIEEWSTDEIIKARQKRLADKTILNNTNLQNELAPGESNRADLYASKVLTNNDEIELNNDVEVTKITRTSETGRKITPISSKSYDKGETVTVTVPTGENRNYIPIIILGISSFIILSTGIIFIKKKIL